MLSFLKGIIEEKKAGIITLDVGGVGYELNVSTDTLSKTKNVGDMQKFFVYMAVRENEVNLFGFNSEEEKVLFLNLTTVSGVGPKTALQILSVSSYANIIAAIVKNDASLLCSAKGIGKKTAERIVLELKEKFAKTNLEFMSGAVTEVLADNSIVNDAIFALISLGLTKQEAEFAVKNEYTEGVSLEELISKALRRI